MSKEKYPLPPNHAYPNYHPTTTSRKRWIKEWESVCRQVAESNGFEFMSWDYKQVAESNGFQFMNWDHRTDMVTFRVQLPIVPYTFQFPMSVVMHMYMALAQVRENEYNSGKFFAESSWEDNY